MLMIHFHCVEPPVINEAPERTTAITGSNVTLVCSINSTLPVNVTWSAPSRPDMLFVLRNASTSGIIYNRNFNIMDVTSDDSGLYTCTGVTIAGIAIATVDVTVGSKLCSTMYCSLV